MTVRTFSMSAGLEASTVTPGSTALLASVTTPAIELWAKPGMGAKMMNASARNPDMDNGQPRWRENSPRPKPNLPVSTISCFISFFLHLHLPSEMGDCLAHESGRDRVSHPAARWKYRAVLVGGAPYFVLPRRRVGQESSRENRAKPACEREPRQDLRLPRHGREVQLRVVENPFLHRGQKVYADEDADHLDEEI